MKQSFKVCLGLVAFDMLDAAGEVFDRKLEVHQPCVDHTAVEVVEAVVGLQFYCSLKLC